MLFRSKTFQWARSQPESPTPEALVRKLRIPELQKNLERGDSLEAASASRLLARIHVWLAFYEPRTYLERRMPDRALTMFEAAVSIGPIRGEGCGLLRSALQATRRQPLRLRGQCSQEKRP